MGTVPDRTRQFNLFEGVRRKELALGLLQVHRAALVRKARRVLLRHLLAHGSGTMDDVRQVVDLPDGVDPTAFGCVPGPLARAHIIGRSGYRQTERAVGHARPLAIWVLVDRAAAEQWLRDHPEPPEVDGGEGDR